MSYIYITPLKRHGTPDKGPGLKRKGPSSSPMISSAGVDPFLVFGEVKVPTWMSHKVIYNKMVGK